MKFHKFELKNAGWELFLLAGLINLFAYLVTRNAGLYPVVFADEMMYSAFSRLTPLAEASIPSYLYFMVYGATDACGDGFLACARILNSAFVVGAGPFIYLTARHFTSKGGAVCVTLLCMLAPINSFTLYFMPETMYFFVFFVLSWVALTRTGWHWAKYALVTGVLLGLMILIKVHALFLVPALAVFVFCLARINHSKGPWVRIGAASACLAVGAALAVKFGVGYAIAGANGLQVFGSFYGNHATSTAQESFWKLAAPGFINLRGHLMGLAVLFGVPLAVLLQSMSSREARAEAGSKTRILQLYTFLMFGAAIGMTVLYTATIADFAPREALRLHVRYYDFAFPLLLIIAAAALGAPQRSPRKVLSCAIALVLAAAIVLAVVKIPTYFLGMVDGPDIAALRLDTVMGRLRAGAGVLILLLWAFRPRAAAWLFLFAFVPAMAYNYSGKLAKFQAQLVNPSPFDKAGLFAHETIKPDERKDMMVAGTGLAELMRTKFHIDDRGVTLLEMPDNAPYELDYIPVRKKWLLVVGPHALPPELKPVVANQDFALVKIAASHRRIGSVDLNGAPVDSLLAGFEGLSMAETWGRWSTGKQVVFRFKSPLPKVLNVILSARAFGPNTEQQFVARVGKAEKRFRVPATPTEVYMRFETDGLQDTLSIEVPQPVSPSALGVSVDKRTIGIGLMNIEIGTPPN